MTYVIAARRGGYAEVCERLKTATGADFALIRSPEDLSASELAGLGVKKVFFVHWSNRIPADIFQNFECVGFHMTDLPYGRGGSPLQNLIVRGETETRMSAFRIVEEVDAGPVYLKRRLSLHGTAEEIFLRAQKVVEQMILNLIEDEPVPKPQEGEVVEFSRRQPDDGDLAGLPSLREVYDHVRMLDAEGYPNAFVDVGPFRIEFSRAALKGDHLMCDARIRVRK